MRCVHLVFALPPLVWLNVAHAQDSLVAQTQALVVIANAANSICYSVTQGGEKTTAIVNSAIQEVASLKIQGSEELASESYKGVVQSELAATLKFTQECRKSVFDTLVVRMLPTLTSNTGLPVSRSVHLRPRTVELPSIDCNRTNEPVEDLLCADADLAEWDGRMGKLYRNKMARLSGDDQHLLRQRQRDWIKNRDSYCKVPKAGNWSPEEMAPEKPCILEMIKQRVAELTNQ
jgi:uncharacterized protein YecT (DUF1311 family)